MNLMHKIAVISMFAAAISAQPQMSLAKIGDDSKASSKSEKAESSNISIPIFYLTDREEEKGSYGSKRRYIVDCKHDMYYGSAEVVQPNYAHKDASKFSEQLGWKKTEKVPRDPVSCSKIDPADSDKAKAEFFKKLEAGLAASGSDRVCLFVHGACEGFDEAAEDAANMAYALEYPVILYSWPSVPKTLEYVVDGGNNEWSQEHFNLFLKDLIQYHQTHKLHLIIVSHSMGNRLVIRSAHSIAGTGLVKDAELVSPDIDAETFKHYVLGLENQGVILRLYSSTRDKMLALSQMVYGGYYRLGEGVGTVFTGNKRKDKTGTSASAAPGSAQAANESPSISKVAEKSADSESNSGAPAVPASSGNQLPAHKKGFAERIDFTAIDTGLRGHSIPFDMLASMIRDDLPGKGLKLVASTPGKGSELSRFMSWSHHLGKIEDPDDKDLCKKIIKDESSETKKTEAK